MFAILQTWLCKSPSIFEISLQHSVWTPCKDISFEEQQKQGSSVEGDHEELKVTQAQAVSSPTLAGMGRQLWMWQKDGPGLSRETRQG